MENKDENMKQTKNDSEVIDLRIIFKKIWAKKKIYAIVLPVALVLSCAYILCIPRTYTSSLSLAPELNNSSNLGGTIGSLASSFGIDLGSMETTHSYRHRQQCCGSCKCGQPRATCLFLLILS